MPTQLRNTGTTEPVESDPLNQQDFENVCRYLDRQLVVIHGPKHEKSRHKVAISDMNGKEIVTELGNLRKFFRELGFKMDDVHFANDDSLAIPLEYIEHFTDFLKSL